MKRATEDHVVKAKEGEIARGRRPDAVPAERAGIRRRSRRSWRAGCASRAWWNCSPRATSKRKPTSRTRRSCEELLKAIEKAKLELEAKIAFDEEHSLYEISVLTNGRRAPHQLGAGVYGRIQAPAHAAPGNRGDRQAAVHDHAQRRQGHQRNGAAASWTTFSKTPRKNSPSRVSRASAK